MVAEEIRKLADDSAKAAGEIGNNVANITAQTQGTDGYHRVIGRAVHLLLGGHLCAQLILIYFVRIDIGQIITLHDLVRNSHFDPCPFSL